MESEDILIELKELSSQDSIKKSEFLGNLKVEKINGEYFCPVKEKHMDNVNATCHYCILNKTPIFRILSTFTINHQ